ncbi:N-formylglutamate amidohydrolase [Patescibacteria group bacterium]|nr:N-formylglutamate amidohydrolase [Patescibacteria group bacterium]MBU1123431.1 N-formylglutamate amidohydrolase [Patescibacteria group bacterium]MBU1911773.1 N-formylglutamate amidohydrolase [Patescibacteria group bacterium]
MSSSIRPILVSIPHASNKIPEELNEYVALTEKDLLAYTDLYTEEIFSIKDVHLIKCNVSRVIVDVNRAPDDISKEYAQAEEGVTVHTTWDGRSVYKKEPSPELADSLIKKYHDPFHEKIDEAIPHARFMIDGHSFLPVGPKLKNDSGQIRPDINIGNGNYTSCSREQTVFFREFFQERGYSVEINFPYSGKYILGHHCHRRRIPPFLVPGIQIEINQGLYVKEGSHDAIPERVEEFHGLFERLVEEFVERYCPE